jgi:hypothetical protein
LRVQRDGRNFTVDVASDGEGLVSHAGAALLAETADRVGLTRALSVALAGVRERRGRHDPGRRSPSGSRMNVATRASILGPPNRGHAPTMHRVTTSGPASAALANFALAVDQSRRRPVHNAA